MNENLQEKQPQNNNDGKKLVCILLVVLGWLLFVFGLMFASSKCSKATKFAGSNVSYNEGQVLEYNNNGTITTLQITYTNSKYMILTTNSSCTYMYYRGSLSGSTITTTYYTYICNNDSQSSRSGTNNWQIHTNDVNTNYVVKASYQDGYNAGYSAGESDGYDDGYAMGLSIGTASGFYDGKEYALGLVCTYAGDSNCPSYSDTNLNNELDSIYNDGYTDGNTAGYNTGYTAGVSEVETNPNNYNLYTQTQYNNYGTSQYNAGVSYADGRVNTSSASYTSGYSAGNTAGYNTGYTAGVSEVENNPNDYSLYTQVQYNNAAGAGYNDGYAAGASYVVSHPNDYSLYTQTQYNNYGTSQYNAGVSYADGRLNTSSVSYNTGYTDGYNVGSSSSSNFKLGQVDMLNYFSSNFGSGTVYSATGTGAVGNPQNALGYEVSIYYAPVVRDAGKLSVLNYVSGKLIPNLNYYSRGTGTTYTSYSDTSVDTELLSFVRTSDYIQSNDLLNYLSQQPEFGGTGTLYNINDTTSWNQRYVDLMDEVNAWTSTANGNGFADGINYARDYTLSEIANNPSYYGYITISDSDTLVSSARSSGYSSGYQQGKLDYENVDVSLPHTIIAIASVPLTVLTSMFNFDVLGINLFVFVSSLITLLIVIWVIKKIAGK